MIIFAHRQSVKKMKKAYITLDISSLPDYQKEAALNNSLVLNDNFTKEIRWDHYETTGYQNVPIKLDSAIVLLFCLQGDMKLRGSMTDYEMHAGDVSISKSGLFGELKSLSKNVKLAYVMMSDKFYMPIFAGHDMAALQKRIVTNPVCHLSDSIMEECMTLYTLIKKRLNENPDSPLQEDVIRGYLQALSFCVYSQFEIELKQRERPVILTRQQETFNLFMELLQKHYTKERNVNFYADKLCITPRYLSRIIRETSGHFAGEHIDLFVIAEAKQLLRSKQYTVLQVSEMLNFSSQSLFGRYFKKFTGYSPKQYQNLE